MTLTLLTSRYKRFGDVEPKSGLYFIDPMADGVTSFADLSPKAILVADNILLPMHHPTLVKMFSNGVKPEEYVDIKIYSPKLLKPVMQLDYNKLRRGNFKETYITKEDHLAMVPQISMLVPRMATSVTMMSMKFNHHYFFPNIYFTTVEELESWKARGQSELTRSILLKRKL